MIGKFRIIFAISHLAYAAATIPLLQKFHSPTSLPFSLLSFSLPATPPPLISRLFKPKPHSQLLQLYLHYLEMNEERPTNIAYQSLELNLRQRVMRELKEKLIKIKVERFNPFQSELIEERQFRGVFIHRNLNLNSQSYDITPHHKGSATFALKKSLRSEAVLEYQRVIQSYQKDKMKDIYCQEYEQFQKDKQITRRIYRIIADICLTVQRGGEKWKLGDGPTEHLLQVESVFNRSYRQEEFFLTDVDFLLKGNYFLRERFK